MKVLFRTYQTSMAGKRVKAISINSWMRIFSGIILIGVVILLTTSCSTRLGYIRHDVYQPMSALDDSKPVPYAQVKRWAIDVSDAYDSRATFNRQAIYGGALVATAGASALVGLSAFAPGSAAIIGVPIGTTFLAGVMTIYNNDQKAVIYSSASQTIRALLIQSDCRLLKNGDDKMEAVCLHAEVSEVMRKVEDHITFLDPKNVTDAMKAVGAAVAVKKDLVDQKEELWQKAEKKYHQKSDNATLQKAQEDARAELEKAKAELAAAAIQALPTFLTSAGDLSDLKEVPQLCVVPDECPKVRSRSARTQP